MTIPLRAWMTPILRQCPRNVNPVLAASSDLPPHQQATMLHFPTRQQDALHIPLTGHVDIVGAEAYLNATPELLSLAGNRLRHRYWKTVSEDGNS